MQSGDITLFLMYTGNQEIGFLGVKCDSKCGWKGTVRTLADRLTTCGFTPIPCSKQCKAENGEINHVMKKDLRRHLAKDCPNRADKCEYCGEKGTYDTIKKVHDEICPLKLLPCSNSGCTQKVQRQQFYKHVQFECEHTVIECKHAIIGCDTKLKRNVMAAHEQDDTLHLHMAINKVTLLTEQCYTMKRKYRTFQVTEYQENNALFCSPSFYTSPNGYHLNVEVYANGNGTCEGTHVSVFVRFLEGKH